MSARPIVADARPKSLIFAKPRPAPADALDWRSSGTLELFDFLVDSVMGASGFDRLLHLLTGGTGEIVVPLSALPALPTRWLKVRVGLGC